MIFSTKKNKISLKNFGVIWKLTFNLNFIFGVPLKTLFSNKYLENIFIKETIEEEYIIKVWDSYNQLFFNSLSNKNFFEIINGLALCI